MKRLTTICGGVSLAVVLLIAIRHLRTSFEFHSPDPAGGNAQRVQIGVDRKREDRDEPLSGKTGRNQAPGSVDEGGLDNLIEEWNDIATRHPSLPELLLELAKLKERLPADDFNRIIRKIVASDLYSPEDKAEIFNKIFPLNNANFPLYQDTLHDWGLQTQSELEYFKFVDLLESPEIRRNLAISYLMAKCRSKDTLAEVLADLADLSKPSFLGEGAQTRSLSIKSIIDSMIASRDITREEAVSLIQSVNMGEELRNALLYRLGEREDP